MVKKRRTKNYSNHFKMHFSTSVQCIYTYDYVYGQAVALRSVLCLYVNLRAEVQ